MREREAAVRKGLGPFIYAFTRCDRRQCVASSLVCLVCLTVLSGCKNIEFEASTVVAPDGSVTRTTRYVADDSKKGELTTRYELPSGGDWTSKKTTRQDSVTKKAVEVTTHIYELTKRYAVGEAIPSDFVRRAKTSDRVARNQIRLNVHDYVFVKMFDYEERFLDIVTKEGFETAARKLYAGYVEHFAGQLAQESENRISLAQAREKLKVAFEPLLVQFLAGIRNERMAFLRSKTFKEGLEPSLQDEQIVDRVVGTLPPPSAEQADAWREAVARALMKTQNVTGNWEDTALEEELFGVHGFDIFGDDYDFTVGLSLPGKLLESNASKHEHGQLTWEFTEDTFRWKEHVIRARSRLVYSNRIRLAVGAILVVFVAWAVAILRKKRR